MSAAFGRNRGRENDGYGPFEGGNSAKAMSMRNLRRRPNATTNSNGQRRNSFTEGSESSHSRRGSRGFPKSLAPFVHLRDTSAIEAQLDEIENSRHKFKLQKQADVENQGIANRTITYNRENSMPASFLTNNSVNDFNTSGLTNESTEDPESKTNGQASKNPRKSYDSGCHDDIVDSGDGETENDSKSVPIDPDTLCGKFQLSRRTVGKIVNNAYVQITIIIFIVLNGILIGVSTTAVVQDNPEADAIVNNIDLFFLSVFTIEIAMQLYYYALALFKDAWLVFDLVVVIISWTAFIQEEMGTGDGSDLTVLRAFRIFRAARLVTRVAPLRDLVLALGEVLPKMYAIVGLLLVIFYVFAVLFTEQFSDVELEAMYFTKLHDSFLSCFQMMTMEWVDIARPLMEEKKQAYWSIVIFVMIAGFIVFNLIVAVVVEAVAATEDSARHEDGAEWHSPAAKVAEAEERIDLLNCHVSQMMEQQEQIQSMLESLVEELLHLETERMKAQQRENRLRDEIDRRMEDQNKIEEGDEDSDEKSGNDAVKKISMQFLHKIQAQKAARKKEEEELGVATLTTSDHESVNSSSVKRKTLAKSLSAMSRDGSAKSIGSLHSGDSISSIPKQMESPSQSRNMARRKTDGALIRPSTYSRVRSTDTAVSGEPTTRRKTAIGNWKNLLVAAQKDPTI